MGKYLWENIHEENKNIYNINKIHPYSQGMVGEIVRRALKEKDVTEVIVFGSSVTSRCHQRSDVDVYLGGVKCLNEEFYDGITERFKKELDIWTEYMVDKRLMDEIKKKGVLVYDRAGRYFT